MIIHGDIISPFVRMTIVTAHEAGIGDKVARAAARVAPTEANTDLEAHSPLARVPVLVTDHGHAIHCCPEPGCLESALESTFRLEG